jgi:hypothetical protein
MAAVAKMVKSSNGGAAASMTVKMAGGENRQAKE